MAKTKATKTVLDFLLSTPKRNIFTSVVCIAEIRKGIEANSNDDLQNKLKLWLDDELRPFFGKRILQISEDVVLEAIQLADLVEKSRAAVNMADCWIAATANVHKVGVVTRNAKDMVAFGIPIFNPWTGERFNGA